MNSSITRLSLWKNNFCVEGAEASPQQNRCEVSMDVLQFDTTICIVAQAIASALMVNRSVKVINLEGNNMGVLGAKAAWDAEGRECYCTAWEVRTTISGQL